MRAWTILSILFAVPTLGREPPQPSDVQPEAASDDTQPGASDAGNLLAFRAGFIWNLATSLKALAGGLWPEGSQQGRALQSNGKVDLCSAAATASPDELCQMFFDAGHKCTSKWSDACTTDSHYGAQYNSYELYNIGCSQCPMPLDSCVGAMAKLNLDSCGEEAERTPGTGKCASDACTALVGTFTDAKVELMATGLASCTGDRADYAHHYGHPAGVKTVIQEGAKSCGLTAPFSPPTLDTCYGAMAKLNLDSCGEEAERTPGTGKCASDACTALVGTFTDAKVELMATGLASCTGDRAVYAQSSPGEVKMYIQEGAKSCGLTAFSTPPPSSPPSEANPDFGKGNVGGDFLLEMRDGCNSNSGSQYFMDVRNMIKGQKIEAFVIKFDRGCEVFASSCFSIANSIEYFMLAASHRCGASGGTHVLRGANKVECNMMWCARPSAPSPFHSMDHHAGPARGTQE